MPSLSCSLSAPRINSPEEQEDGEKNTVAIYWAPTVVLSRTLSCGNPQRGLRVETGRACWGGSSGLQESTTHQIFATALHVLEAVRFYEYQCLEAIIICVSEVLLLFPLVL